MNRLFDLNFYDRDLNSLVDTLKKEVENEKKVSVFTPNIDHVINNEDSKVKEIYSESEYIIADGWPVVLTGKIKKKSIYRITGVDLMDGLFKIANENSYNLFFLGAEDKTLITLKENIRKDFPKIGEINLHNGYFDNDDFVIKKINESKSKILFVGMGNPKQEIWIRKNMNKLNVNVILAVGGAFKIFSKEIDRAPEFVQKIGMEWFFRFLKEPKRLFARYFIKYPRFIKIFFKELSNKN